MMDVPKGRYIQEGVSSPPAGINLPLNTQYLPDSAFYLVFPVAIMFHIFHEVPSPQGQRLCIL